jgi:hypothetical protein
VRVSSVYFRGVGEEREVNKQDICVV